MKDFLRQMLNILFAITQALSPFFSQITGRGNPIWSPVNQRVTLPTPPNFSFAIWSVIFVLCFAYAGFQALPSNKTDPLLRAIGWLTALAFLGNTIWGIENELHGIGWPTFWLILFILAPSCRAAGIIGRSGPATRQRALLIELPIGALAGWISVATFVNLSQSLAFAGHGTLGLNETAFAVILILVAGLASSVVTVRTKGSFPYVSAVCWALVGVVIANLTRDHNLPVAIAAGWSALFVFAALAFTRLRRPQVIGSNA